MKHLKKLSALLLTLAMVLAMVPLAACGNTATPAPAASGSAQAPANSTAPTPAEGWDEEVDLLIVGYGLAGAVAATEAYDIDPNAKILVLEKMPQGLAGGNSIASGQTFIVPSKNDLENFKTYMRACNEPNPIPEDYLDWWSAQMADQLSWVEQTVNQVGYEVGYVGGGPLRWGSLVVEFGEFPGAGFEGCSAHLRKAGSGAFEVGGVWKAFNEAVKYRNIEVRYETPALDLVQDPETKAITGVLASSKDGKEFTIKANKGVVLACGGFENNLEMQRNFHGMDQVRTAGTPGNTGDGIEMLMKVGAKMWHMNNQTQSGGFWLGIEAPEHEATFMRNMTFTTGSWIEIDSQTQRFYNESKDYHRQHMKYMEYGRFVDLPHERALPVHLIFDENLRQNDSVASQWLSWPITTEGYVWSKDNQTEIDKGWIVKADTIEELAQKIGRDPAELKAAVDRYNSMVAKGVDEDFGRDPATMQKIEKAPFYAVSLVPTLVATTGGAQRDTQSRVLDWNEQPIPGLFEAGELGSYVSNLYQNGVFLSEAILSGRAAAQSAMGGKSSVGTQTSSSSSASSTAAIALDKIPDGTYTATVAGTHGDYQVIATMAGGKLTKVEIGEGKENMFIKDDQLSTFTKSIIDQQSVDVDVISGATMDCQGIAGAVREALTKAAG